MKLTFLDLDGAFTRAVGAELPGADLYTGDVAALGLSGVESAAFVSPSNSRMFMDGGIDNAYRRMWPGIEKVVRERMASLGYRNLLGAAYLPLGAAMAVSVGAAPARWLIMAPTMWLPQDVSRTRNAYFATMAALLAAARLGVQQLVVPAMCCGYGKMPPREAARQCAAAVRDFRDTPHLWVSEQCVLCTDAAASPQPKLYTNTPPPWL